MEKNMKTLQNLHVHTTYADGKDRPEEIVLTAIEKGFLTERAILESLLSIKRAGADLIITNFAPYMLLNELI